MSKEVQLGLKEGSETAALPREPTALTFTILKHSLVVNSKPDLVTESLDFFSMWKNGMLLTFGGVPGKFEWGGSEQEFPYACISNLCSLQCSILIKHLICHIYTSIRVTFKHSALQESWYKKQFKSMLKIQFSVSNISFQPKVRLQNVHTTCVAVWRKSLSRARLLILIRRYTNTQRCHPIAVQQKQ